MRAFAFRASRKRENLLYALSGRPRTLTAGESFSKKPRTAERSGADALASGAPSALETTAPNASAGGAKNARKSAAARNIRHASSFVKQDRRNIELL